MNTLRNGDWRFLSLAVLAELLWITNLGALFKSIYKVLGVNENLGFLVLLATATNFINIIAPSAGIGGMAFFVSESRSHGNSSGQATVASALFVIFDYIGFLIILSLGIVVLIRRNQITAPEISASGIMLISVLSLIGLLYLGANSEGKLAGVLSWIVKKLNRIVKLFRPKSAKDYFPVRRAHEFAHEINSGVGEIRKNPRNLLFPILLALNSKVLMILVLFFVFLAFKIPVSIGTIIAGFCVAYLFSIVSPTPSGIGIVEGLLTVTLRSFYIPLGAATVVTLAYRGFTFWLPLLFGFGSFRLVGSIPSRKSKMPTS